VQQSTVGGLQVTDACDAIAALGVDRDALCRDAGLDPAALPSATARVPLRRLVALFAAAEARTGDPLIGLHAGEHVEPRSPLAYLLMSSARLGAGLDAWRRSGRLIADGLQMEIVVRGAVAHVVFCVPSPAPEVIRHPVEHLLVKCVRALRRAGGAGLAVHAVHLHHAARGPRGEAERVFGCAVEWDRPDCRVVLPARGLEAPPQFANPVVAEQVERLVAGLVGTAGDGFRAQVADATRALLVGGCRADAETVAARLHVSHRTLQRPLEAEGTSFRAVRDEAMWPVVDTMLANPALTVEAVALSVGFSDVAAFSKAFKRRAGCAPSGWRRRVGVTPR
jgi:AraC-like DNA-binding protein